MHTKVAKAIRVIRSIQFIFLIITQIRKIIPHTFNEAEICAPLNDMTNDSYPCKITPKRANITSRVTLRLCRHLRCSLRPRERPGKLMQNFQSEINN